MLSETILEKILEDDDSHKVPFCYQTTMIDVFDKVLTDIRKEKQNATINDLLSTNAIDDV